MAARTSSATGNLSDGTKWVGGVAPVNGDTIVVANGHVITVDVNIQLGSNASNVGHAVTINGSTSASFGTLIVADGVTLTLQGNDRSSNTWMSIARFGSFLPAPGAIIEFDAAADAESLVLNAGIINATGNKAGGKPITWRGASGNRTWNTAAAFIASSLSPSAGWYDDVQQVVAYTLGNPWVSNAAGTGLGSFGDSSLSFASITPVTALQTEVATYAEVNALGKYCVDYEAGIVYFYLATVAAPAYTANYKRLTFTSGTIHSVANTTYNEAIFQDCVFEYMGEVTSIDTYLLFGNNKQSDTVSSSNHRNFKVKNCTFTYCKRIVGIKNSTGTAGDPIVIDDNDFGYFQGDTAGYGQCISMFRAANSYLSIQRNRAVGFRDFIVASTLATNVDQLGHVIRDNVVRTGQFIFNTESTGVLTWTGCTIERNFIFGFGSAGDYRVMNYMGGASGQEAYLQDNVFWRGMRVVNYKSHLIVRRNVFGLCYHHNVNGPQLANDAQMTNIRVRNCIFIHPRDGGAVEFGYNKRQWADDVSVEHCTIYDSQSATHGAVPFVDSVDNAGPMLVTKQYFRSNIIYSNIIGVRRAPDLSGFRARLHFAEADYNNVNGNTTNFALMNRFATFLRGSNPYNTDATRNVLGVALWDPLYSAGFTGKNLVLTYTSATNQTLTWDGGAAVALVLDNSTATAGTTTTLTDSAKTFQTAQDNAATPKGNWVRITGGTGAGQTRWISNNTATVLTVTPAFSVAPDATSTYTILKAEAKLFDSGATNYVWATIDWRDVPTSSQTDALDMELHGFSVDPDFVDATRTLATWDASLGGSGTEQAAFARLYADTSLVYSSLLPYLQAGFAPRAATLQNAGHDGVTVGAIEGIFGHPAPRRSKLTEIGRQGITINTARGERPGVITMQKKRAA